MAGNTVELRIKAISDFGDVLSNVKSLRSALQNIKMPDKLSNSLQKNINDTIVSVEKLQQKSQQGFKKPADVSAFEKELNKADVSLNKVVTDLNKLNNEDLIKLNIDTTRINELKAKITDIKKEMSTNVKGAMLNPTTGLKDSFSGMDQIIKKGTVAKQIYDQFVNSVNRGNFSGAKQAFNDLENHLKRFGRGKIDSEQWKAFETAVKSAMGAAGIEVEKLAPKLAKLDKEIDEVTQVESNKFANNIGQMKNGIQDTANGFGVLADRERQAANEMLSMSQQMSQLKTQANYFFGLQNMFQLLKRGIRDAVDTIKELDASMTETAVVTDFSVSDMWNMLPEYTKAANELGSTINDVYQAATLYYQQGLEQDQAMGLATETLKMARIGGLEAAEATDMMTAALRGFNMELDETSAKRINDVYSNLAAKTASDTRELGEAMERTASISHSANMEFETTAAFLANMIETTREAPENLGTAMKTIVARFQELKENPYEIGEVEGEEVSFNRVDKALQTIGVKLTESRDKFRDLDDVFLEISQKWDGLSQTQQRYIATTAAGSRQQSRFIAMVANYKRTMELVSYANNAAGASNIQFSKTLDSMAAKANRFKTAWQQFIMGITDNKLIKGAVDFGTTFLSAINKVINAISGGNGLIKSVLSLGAAFMGLKVAGKFINGALGVLGKAVDPTTKGGFFAGVTGRKAEANAAQAKMINQPIVTVLRQILSVMPKQGSVKNAPVETALSRELFKQQYRGIRDILYNGVEKRNRTEVDPKTGQTRNIQAYKFSDIAAKMEGMDSRQQAYIMKNNPALKGAFSKGLFNMLSGGKTDLTTADKLQFKAWGNNLQKYAQTPGTGLEMTDLMAPSTPESQQKIIEGLTKVAPEVNEAYAKNYQEIQEKFSKTSHFQNLSAEQQENALKQATLKRMNKDLNLDFGAMNVEQQITKTDKLAQGFGKAGGAIQGAGMAMQSFGQALAAAGLETAGSLVSSLGTAFMGVGGAISGIGSALQFISAGPLIGIAVAIGAIVTAVALWKKHQQDVKDAAQEVADNYKKTTEETTKNLSTLEEYRDEYQRLSQGVDENGKNVSLGTEEYQDYLKMTNEIAAMSPTLVKGYNSEGNAILDKNKAIEESIRLQKEEQKQATEDYTKLSAIKKTQEAMEQDENYKLGQTKYASDGMGGTTLVESDIKQKGRKAINLIVEAGGEDILKRYGIDPEHINDAAIRLFDQQGNAIYKEIESTMADLEEEELENIEEAVSDFGDDQKKFKESYAEELNQFKTLAADRGYYEQLEELGTGYGQMLDQGIESIVANTSLDAEQKMDEVEAYYQHLRDLDFTSISDQLTADAKKGLSDFQDSYRDAYKNVEKAQDDYLANFNSEEYTNATQSYIDDIERWAEAAQQAYADTGDVQYQLLYENLANQHALWESFTESNVATIEQGFNTLTDEIAEVNKAYETFQKETEGGDYYTGADNLNKIYDDIRDGIDDTGEGSRSFWEGGEHLVSESLISEHDVDKVADRMDQIHSYLYEDLEKEPAGSGLVRWYDDLTKRIKNGALKELGKEYEDFITIGKDGEPIFNMANATAEQFENVANALGLSTEAFTALLNKARQYSDIEFANPDLLKEAVKHDENVKAREDGKFVATRDYLESAAESVGMSLEDVSDSLDKAGIKILESADHYLENENGKKLTGKDRTEGVQKWLSTLGIETSKKGKLSTEDLVSGSIGYATKEDIQSMYDAAVKSNLITDADEVEFKDVYAAALAAEEDPIQSNISTKVTDIASNVSEIAKYMAVDQGILADEQKGYGEKAWKELTGEEGKADTWEQLFAHGKNADESVMSETQYENSLKKIQAEKETANHEIGILNKQLTNAKAAGNDKEADAIQEQLDYWEKVLAELERVEKKGTENRDNWTKKIDKEEVKNGEDFTDKQRNIIIGTQLEKTQDVTDFLNTMKGDKETIFKVAAELDKPDADVDDIIKMYKGDLTEEQIRKIKFVVDNKGANAKIDTTEEKAEEASEDRDITFSAIITKALRSIAKVDRKQVDDKDFSINANDNASDTVDSVDRKNIANKSFNIIANMTKGTGGNLFSLALKALGFSAKGHNNYISHQTIPTIGSLAKGNAKKFNHGTVGPNDKGGPTLTGEEGFEIAWIPSENRSMILGAKGPQMVNLPKEAVVWTNEQSKKIIKQKAIPAGSHTGPSGPGKLHLGTAGTGGTGGSGGTGGDTITGKVIKTGKSGSDDDKVSKRTIELIKHGKLTVYVYNMTKKIEQVERKIAKWQDIVNKKLEKASTTLANMTYSGNKYISYLKQEKSLNNQLAKYYQKRLTNLNKKGRTTIEWSNSTREEEKKKGGKWKKKSNGTKKNKATINLGKYIKRDKNTGAYVIDQAAINRAAGKDKNKAKAIRDKAKEKIDEYTSGRDNALDKIKEAQDKLDELGQQLYDTFFGWENELTKIFNLNQKVNALEEKRAYNNAKDELNASLIASGMQNASEDVIKTGLDFYKKQLKNEVDQIKKRNDLIKAQKENINRLLSTSDERKTRNSIQKRLNNNKAIDKAQAKKNKAQSKYNKAVNKKKNYQETRKYIKDHKLSKKKREKAESVVKKLSKKKNLSKSEKEDLKKAKARLAADKKARKLEKTNSTRSLTRKNKKRMNRLDLEAKTEKAYRKRIKALEKKQKKGTISKKEKKELANKKKALRNDRKAEKWIDAYEAKTQTIKGGNLYKRLQRAKKRLTQAKKRDHYNSTERLARQKEVDALNEEIKNTNTAKKYIKTTKNADGTVSVDIDYSKLEKDKENGKISEELYNFIKDYYDQIETANSELMDAYQAQVDAIHEMSETLSSYIEAYASRSEELLSALEEKEQKQIDKLNKLNDSLSNALKELLDEVKKRLDQRRQQEENAKTEEDIASKQQRLAALRADNSGSNAKEIKQLEKEIADAQLNYTRTLEDQTLQRMQDEADEASQQRQKQIELLSAQLEYQKQTGILAAQVNKWLDKPIKFAATIREVWYSDKGYQALTAASQDALNNEFESFTSDISKNGLPARIAETKEAIQDALKATNDYLNEINQNVLLASGKYVAAIKAGATGREVQQAGNLSAKQTQKQVTKAGAPQSTMAGVKVSEGADGKRTYTDAQGKKHTYTVNTSNGTMNASGTRVAAAQNDKIYFEKWDPVKGHTGEITGAFDINTLDPVKHESVIKNNKSEFKEAFKYAITHQAIGSKINKNTKKLVEVLGVAGKEYKLANGIYGSVADSGNVHYNNGTSGVKVWKTSTGGTFNVPFSKNTKSNFYKNRQNKNIKREYTQVNDARKKANEKIKDKKKKYSVYKTGGLASTTGPAWLDGTPSKPELVLNAQDTKNFLTLKDTLTKAVSGTGSIMNDTNMTYDIDINVDHIANDYDVDQIANRVQKKIVQSAGYRNVNAVRNLR